MAGEADTPRERTTPIAAEALKAMRTPRQTPSQAAEGEGLWTPPPGTEMAGGGPPHLGGAPLNAPPGELGIPNPMQPPQSSGKGRGAAQATSGNTVARDPLARPYDLPSGGVCYGQYGHHKTILMVPTRGAQENVMAGAADSPEASVAMLRKIMRDCVDTGPIPYEELVLFDWVALVLNWLSYCNGSDIIGLRPKHGKCKPFLVTFPMAELPCRVLRFAGEAEDVNWPPVPEDEEAADVEAILREMEREEDAAKGVEEFRLSPSQMEEPFETDPLPITNEVITWRLPRVADVETAEDFAARLGDANTDEGNPMHSFLLALQIVAINGRRVSRLEAMRWVQGSATQTLSGFRDHTGLRSWGYDTRPRFRCPCGASFKVRLPLDGAMFRRRPPRSKRS